jgi:ABC-2 type transport system ATP-binding protein
MEEKAYLISTHQVRDLNKLIDHILILNNRKLILNAGLEETTEKLASRLVLKS